MLRNERVRLRAVEPEDLDLMYLIENDSSLWSLGATTVPYSRFSLKQFIDQTRNDIFLDGQLRLVIENENADALGFIDLQGLEPRHRRAEVGIVLLPGYQGLGYASEALRLLSQYARQHLCLRQLVAIVALRNEPARRLFQRAGFTCLSTLPQWLSNGDGYEDALLWQKLF